MRSATTTSRLPLGGGGSSLFRAFTFDGAQPPPEGTTYGAYWVEVGPEYFETLAARPVAGRLFTEEDDGAAPLVAIVDEAMARRMGEGREIVGRSIRWTYEEDLPREVVGVVANIQLDSRMDASPDPVVFVPRAQAPRASMRFVIRTDGDAAGVLPAVRGEMTALDPDVAT